MRLHTLGPDIVLCTDGAHTFGTDAFLLAAFSRPKPGELACDLGTGCGVVPMLWAAWGARHGQRPPKEIWGLELLPAAAELFAESVRRSRPPCPILPVCGDLREPLPEPPAGSFHLVSCNPPYFCPGTGALSRDAAARAARHEGACTLPEVCGAAARLLRFGGRFSICCRPARLPDAMQAFRDAGLEPKRLRLCAKDAQSAPGLFLLEGKKGGRPSLRLEPQWNLYQEGRMTPEFAAIYE